MALKDFDQLSHEIDQAVHVNGPLGKTTAPGLNSVLKSLATELTTLPQTIAAEVPDGPGTSACAGLQVVAVATLSGSTEEINAYYPIPVAEIILDIMPDGSRGGWDQDGGKYVVPVSGIYEISATVRLTDGEIPVGGMYMLGAGANELKKAWFAWDTVVKSISGIHNTFQFTRIASLNAEDEVYTYIYCEEFKAEVEGETSLKLLRYADKSGEITKDKISADTIPYAAKIAS